MPDKRSLHYRLCILTLMLATLALLAGCQSTTVMNATPPSASPTPHERMPTALPVIRLSPLQNHVAPFDVQTDQAEKVQRLFASLRALPPFVPQISCPADQGGGYLLTFRDSEGIVAQARIAAGGCIAVDISKPYGCHKFNAAIMEQIADTLGVQHSALGIMGSFWDSATPGGPTAPVEPSETLLPFSPCH